METSAEQSHFKYIPFRCYVDDGYKQKLVKPVTNDGQKMCLNDLLKEVFPDRTESKKKKTMDDRSVSENKLSFIFSKGADTRLAATFGHATPVDVGAS